MDLANETFSERNTEPVIEDWLAVMRGSPEAHLRRFYGEESLCRQHCIKFDNANL